MFAYQLKTKVVFGRGSIVKVQDEIPALRAEKILIVTDEGIIDSGIAARLTEILDKNSIKYALFHEIEANPKNQTISKGALTAREFEADAILGIGGGSPLDASKAIAVAATNDEEIEKLCGSFDCWSNPPIPVIAVPTTAGTGSEVSAVALISFPKEGVKRAMRGRTLQPTVAICDPDLTIGLPPQLTATTGIDALSHALEGYVCTRIPNPYTDLLAEKAVELINGNLRQAYANGNNILAREKMLLASNMALMAAGTSGGLGLAHALAHAIGGFYDLPHGLIVAVCLPHVLRYNAIAVP